MARECRALVGRRGIVGPALALLTIGVFVALAAGPGTSAALASCPHANARPHTTSLANLRTAMRCLVNNKRAKHHLHSLKDNPRLASAARRHTKAMVQKNCFKHRCPGEPPLGKRIKRTGYLQGAKRYFYAEDLGFDRTPKRMIQRLTNSRYNRRNILNGDFRDIGVGVGWGAPRTGRPDSKFATYTIVFAWRRS